MIAAYSAQSGNSTTLDNSDYPIASAVFEFVSGPAMKTEEEVQYHRCALHGCNKQAAYDGKHCTAEHARRCKERRR